MKNILITGVAGFIGSNLADHLLAKGYHVTGIDNLTYGLIEQVSKEVNFFKTIFSFFSSSYLGMCLTG